jgi:hypothetical protein
MTKPNPRPSEHVQRDTAAGGRPAGSTAITAGRGDAPEEEDPNVPPVLDPAMEQKYWIVILIWAVGFILMILYEAIAAIWRG